MEESGDYPYCVGGEKLRPSERGDRRWTSKQLCRQTPDYWTLVIAKKSTDPMSRRRNKPGTSGRSLVSLGTSSAALLLAGTGTLS
ncbi:MAG: hypothetical protein MZV70_29830 [Desulfobacterales bacterium]|nr:hypothetical protein [Desulfobacterales bacterium]